MRIQEILETGEYRIPTVKIPDKKVGDWLIVGGDEKVSPGIDSDSVKENPWMKEDPYISDMALMQKMNGLNGHYSELMARYSPYNPDSPYAGVMGRSLYKKYGATIRQMVMQGKTGRDVAAYLQAITGGRVREDIIQLLMGQDPNSD